MKANEFEHYISCLDMRPTFNPFFAAYVLRTTVLPRTLNWHSPCSAVSLAASPKHAHNHLNAAVVYVVLLLRAARVMWHHCNTMSAFEYYQQVRRNKKRQRRHPRCGRATDIVAQAPACGMLGQNGFDAWVGDAY